MLLVDERIGSKELADPLRLLGAPVKVTKLQFADFAFGGRLNGQDVLIGIERKTLPDLLSSKESGRLTGHQLPGLLDAYHKVYLLVEGGWRPGDGGGLEHYNNGRWWPMKQGRKGGFRYAEIDNYLNTLANEGGVEVKRSWNLKESAWQVFDLYNRWQKEKHGSHLKGHTLTMGANSGGGGRIGFVKPNLVMTMALQIPGIGDEGARSAGKRFKTPLIMCQANEGSWGKVLRTVKGEGKGQVVRGRGKLAGDVVRLLTGGK